MDRGSQIWNVASKPWRHRVLWAILLLVITQVCYFSEELYGCKNEKKNFQQQSAPYTHTLNTPPMNILSPAEKVGDIHQHDVALCAIQKGAEGHLDEWINYNLAIGFARIIVHDNSDDFTLQHWAQNQKVNPRIRVIHRPGIAQQLAAYTDCIETLRSREKQMALFGEELQVNWVALFDMDEFVVLKRHDHISDLLRDHCPEESHEEKGCGALVLNWFFFGSNGETSYQPMPLTKRFQHRESATNQHVKSIVRLKAVQENIPPQLSNPHCVISYKTNYTTFDTNGPAGCPFNVNGPHDVAVINHYYTRSKGEWKLRCQRGAADQAGNHYCVPMPEFSTPVFDNSAWLFLKNHVPAYEWYDRSEVLFGRHGIETDTNATRPQAVEDSN